MVHLPRFDIMKIKSMQVEGFQVAEIPIIYYKNNQVDDSIKDNWNEVLKPIRVELLPPLKTAEFKAANLFSLFLTMRFFTRYLYYN